MDVALRNAAAMTARPVDALWPMASRTPAAAAGVADRKGSLEVGKDADLVLLDPHGRVTLTVVEGRVVHEGDAP
jgi:N-acetylglucosamine-6-phosphate deacetylase